MREKKKRNISISLEIEDIEKLKKLFPYSSALISILVREFFRSSSIEEIWSSIEAEKPLPPSERLTKLENFVRKKINFSTRQVAKNKGL